MRLQRCRSGCMLTSGCMLNNNKMYPECYYIIQTSPQFAMIHFFTNNLNDFYDIFVPLILIFS